MNKTNVLSKKNNINLADVLIKMSDEEYFKHAAVSRSDLNYILDQTPLHYKANKNGEMVKEQNDGQKLGSVAHTIVFEPELFHSRYLVVSKMRRQGKKWDSLVEEAASNNQEIIWTDERDTILRMVDSLDKKIFPEFDNKSALTILRGGFREGVCLWREFGFDFKAKLDVVYPWAIFDFKTTEKPLKTFNKSITDYNYHRQAPFYVRGFEKATGLTLPFYFIVVEKKPPFDVVIRQLDQTSYDVGYAEMNHAITLLNIHTQLNSWPGYEAKVEKCGLMPWYKSPVNY